MVFLVFKSANRQNNGEVHESYRMAKIFVHSLHLYSQSELQDDNSTLHGISLLDITVDEVASLCCLFFARTSASAACISQRKETKSLLSRHASSTSNYVSVDADGNETLKRVI